MNQHAHIRELTALKTIAETLNRSHNIFDMLQTVLEKLLDVTGLTFGWIFLMDDNLEYTLAAERNLPPALLHHDRAPMRCGSCWCMDQYRGGRLRNAVNILSCRRLDNARKAGTGDTCGFTHHATVPLRIGERKFGILNVGAAGKNHFGEEELALLQSVALQIGVAVERMRLHEIEQRRAHLFARLGEFSRSLSLSVSAGTASVQLTETAAGLIGSLFDWPGVALLEKIGDHYQAHVLQSPPGAAPDFVTLPLPATASADRALTDGAFVELDRDGIPDLMRCWESGQPALRIRSVLAVPIAVRSQDLPLLLLLIGRTTPHFLMKTEGEVLAAIAGHIAVALEHARLEENRRELVRIEERNRLARDLHDSVSQMLFSISMTAKGAEALLPNTAEAAGDAIREALSEMQAMSRDAQKEMRSLIAQLRPPALDGGVAAALREYGQRLGLHVQLSCNGAKILPRAIEEALWRIGQEALNNVAKHAATDRADMALSVNEGELIFVARDNGRGIGSEAARSGGSSFGLSMMRERAEALGGRLKLSSSAASGTLIEVTIPL